MQIIKITDNIKSADIEYNAVVVISAHNFLIILNVFFKKEKYYPKVYMKSHLYLQIGNWNSFFYMHDEVDLEGVMNEVGTGTWSIGMYRVMNEVGTGTLGCRIVSFV